jgi:hypothetical protein
MADLQHAKVLPHKLDGKVVTQRLQERGCHESIHFEIQVARGQTEQEITDTAADEQWTATSLPYDLVDPLEDGLYTGWT